MCGSICSKPTARDPLCLSFIHTFTLLHQHYFTAKQALFYNEQVAAEKTVTCFSLVGLWLRGLLLRGLNKHVRTKCCKHPALIAASFATIAFGIYSDTRSPKSAARPSLFPIAVGDSPAEAPQVAPFQLAAQLVLRPMALPCDPLLEAAAARADRVDEVLPSLDEREEHSVPAVGYVRLDCSHELGLVACAFLLQLLQDDVAEFLEFDGVIGRELTEDLARIHAGGLVEVAPVAGVG